MKERKCAKCGASLTDEDVMKMEFEDGSWEIIPLPVCPDCFAKQMLERAFQ
jgi:NAD-dependent SIR2 family protein deacetylase